MNAPPLVTFTPRAVEHAKDLLARENKVGHGLRLGVRGGGCSGLNYFVAPEDTQKKGDLLLDFDGLTIYLDVKSQLFLIGTEVDWEDGIMASGFRFSNPNAKRSCSCGESFTV